MKLTGKITFVSNETTGESAKGIWVKKYMIIQEETESQYPNMWKIDMFNKTENINVNDIVTVDINGKVNEYQGNHYGSLNLWKIEVNKKAEVANDTIPF